jgi:long-chain-alcohol oxidase
MSGRLGLMDLEPVLASLARGVLGDSYVPEVPSRMVDAITQLASETDRRRLVSAVRALDTRAGALVLTGRARPLTWRSQTDVEDLIARWRTSRFAPQRQLAAAVIAMAASSLYARPGPEWNRLRYPGPLGAAPHEARRLHPHSIDEDTVLGCDAVIVGSGAAGGCVAAYLAARGMDVVVLERGGYYSESDFDHIEAEAARNMYLYGMTLATTDLSVRVIAGATLGGGTVVNFATAFRTPDYVLREWADRTGIDAFISGEFDASLDEVSERLNVNTDSSAAGPRDSLLEEGLKAIGWHVDMMPRAVLGCTQDEACGYCGFGCRVGAKRSSMRTYLEDAERDGARIFVDANAGSVIIDDGQARGVEGSCNGHRLRVEARAVIAAAGAIETPALLLRSGLGGQVGQNLHLHPGAAAIGIFDDEIHMWEGTTQARYSNELRQWDGGYGPILETVPVHPGAASVFLPWTGAEAFRDTMGRYPNVSYCGVLSRDGAGGRIRLDRRGMPRISYGIGLDDERRIAEGVVGAGRVMEAAGAREILSPHATPITYVPGTPGAHQTWADETRRAGYRDGRVTFGSWHQMGSCRMGTDPTTSAIGVDNESHEVSGLFVVDSSTFPTASGVNPMLTIYGIANRAAKRIAERLS